MRGSAAFRTSVTPGGALAGPWVQNPLWASARAVPSLDLRFADTKSLVCGTTGQNLVTFTRASSGTFVGSNGVLQTAVTNLKTFSDAILTANAYSANNSTLTTATLPTPTTSTTASLFTLNVGANTGNNTDGFNFGAAITLTNSTQHTQSLFVKPAGTTVLRLRSNVGGSLFDFTLTGSGTAPIPSSDLQAASIAPFPNGWYRVSWTFTTTTSAPGNRPDYWAIKTNVADGINGVYVVGAQLEQASSVGGYIPTTSAINSAPRFDHNPTTGESLGLLVEEARTNLALRSEEFNDASWVKVGSTVTANTGTAPDGAATADLLTRTTTGVSYATQTFTKAASAIQYTFTVFAKQSVGNFCTLRVQGTYPSRVDVVFNLSSATVSTAATVFGSFTGPSASITPYANGWYRLTVTGTSDAVVALQVLTSFNSNGTVADGTDSVSNSAGLLWGAQLEAGAFPTSYIPTTSATVTRAADVASITGSNFSSWYNQTEGTVFSDCSINYTVPGTSFPFAASLSDGTTNNSIENGFLTSTLAGYEVATGGVAQVGMYPNAGNSLTRRLATSFKFNDFAASVNGGIINADTSGTIPTIDRLRIGGRIASSGTSSLFGTIRRLTYWPTRLANTTLQAITQ